MGEPDQDNLQAWRGFRDLCGLIAPVSPGQSMKWDRVDWDVVIHQAEAHKAGPAVWRSIDRRSEVPNAIKAYFHVVRNMNAQRNATIADGLAAVLARFNKLGIKAAPLKGAASLASDLYDDPAERFLSDVDLLIEPAMASECTDALHALGYTEHHTHRTISWMTPRSHHLPPMLAPSGFCVELHTAVIQRKFESMLPARDVLLRASEARWRGGTSYFLDPTDRIIHNIVHSQLHDLSASHLVELRQLRELACLIQRYSPAIDWKQVERRFRDAGYENVLWDQLDFCRVLMGVSTPIGESHRETSITRLKQAVGNPADQEPDGVTGVMKLTRDYAFWFRKNPTLVLNLLNPFWWPSRIRLILSLLRRRSTN